MGNFIAVCLLDAALRVLEMYLDIVSGDDCVLPRTLIGQSFS